MSAMGTYERRHFFDRICELRIRYMDLAHEDRSAVMDIDEAVALMAAALATEAEAMTADALEAASSRTDYLN